MGQAISLNVEAETLAKAVGRLSFEEFLEWYDEQHAEWVDGEIEMGQPPNLEHQEDSDFLMTLLRLFVETRDAGKVISAPFLMRLEKAGREPDILFVAKENMHRLQRTFLDGAADIAVEIISPESTVRDRGIKFVEYETAGVREYWMIDPKRQLAEFYVLDEDKKYQLIFSGRKGTFHSIVLNGFYLEVEWLWQQPHPKVVPILKEMGVL